MIFLFKQSDNKNLRNTLVFYIPEGENLPIMVNAMTFHTKLISK